jgi:transcriptional regulator with XRE-family HTH domain
MPLGKRLKTLREDKNFSQEYLADELNISQPAYSKWEKGQTDIPYSGLCKIAEIYKISISELTEGLP